MIDDRDASQREGVRLRLLDRFHPLKQEGDEYHLVSLYESLRVRDTSGDDQLLGLVLARLQHGCTLRELLLAVDLPNHGAVRAMVKDLADRGLVVEEAAGGGEEQITARPRDAYPTQARFFSNFRPRLDAPPTDGGVSGVDTSMVMQRALAASSVLIVGLGRSGSRLATGLAHVGVGHINISDPGVVLRDDLIDSGYEQADAGQPREAAVARALERIEPRVECTPVGSGSLFMEDAPVLPDGLNLLVLCEDRFDPDHYAAINRLCLQRSVTWTSYRNLGFRVEAGPLIVPHETACFTCFQLRKSANVAFYDGFLATQRQLAEGETSLGTLNITMGYEVLALEIVKSLTGFSRPLTYGSVFSFDLVTLAAKVHPVLKLPRCRECGNASRPRPTFSIWDTHALFDDQR